MNRKKRILFISRWFPYPPNNGSKLRIYNLLHGLANHYEVRLLCFIEQPVASVNIRELQSFCEEVQIVPLKSYKPRSINALLSSLGQTPRSIKNTYSEEMALRIQGMITKQPPDLIIASQTGTASYRSSFRNLPAIFEEVELSLFYESYKNASSSLNQFRNKLTWEKHSRYLSHLVQSFQACTVVSENEKKLLSSISPDYHPIEIIPNFLNKEDYQFFETAPNPATLIFPGSFNYNPNYEAMVWFLEAVYPLIQAEIPDVKLMITGDHANRPLPPARNVVLTGFMDDVRPLIASAWACVVPILSGGGTRLKIIESMALHTPVITTRKGSEGIDVENGINALIADDPSDFAQATIKLIKESEQRRRLAANAYQLFELKYDLSAVMPRFINMIEGMIQS